MLRAGDERLGCRGAPQSCASSLRASEGVRGGRGGGGVGCGGAALSVPGPTAQRVSDCPGSGISAASPFLPPARPPAQVSQGSTPGDVTTGECVPVVRPPRPLRTRGGSGGAEGRGRRSVGGPCARVHVEVRVPGARWFVKKLCVTARPMCLAETELPGRCPLNIHTCRGWRGGAGPPACLSHLRRDFPGLAGVAGVGGPVKRFDSLWILLFFLV